MPQLAVTVVSHDRPGLIADVTEVLADLGGNLASSSMSLLQGHFAWTLVVDIAADPAIVRERLLAVCPKGVNVLVLEGPEDGEPPAADRLIVSLHGADRIGLVAAVTRLLADAGGNIVELTTHLHGGLYIGTAEVEFPSRIDVDELAGQLRTVADELGVTVTVRREEPDFL